MDKMSFHLENKTYPNMTLFQACQQEIAIDHFL